MTDMKKIARRRLLHERSKLSEIAGAGERAFVEARLKCIFERDHQLDTLERTEPELLERR